MSTTPQEPEAPAPSQPAPEHAWLNHLVGTWTIESEMDMGDGTKVSTKGTETVKWFGPLWIMGEGKSEMPDGQPMETMLGIGFDLTFQQYRGFMVVTPSSHLWKYEGTLSEDGKTLTLECEGPNMMGEGMASYRDIIEIHDENHRTMTSKGKLPDGDWATFVVARYTRAA